MADESGHPPEAVPEDHDITALLAAWRGGDARALDRVFPRVYGELRRIAHARLAGEREDHTLGTTALVHEAYLKLVDQSRAQWESRAQFFAVAARAMRRILVDYARSHQALKRGGGAGVLRLDDDAVAGDALAQVAHGGQEEAVTLLALDDALARLAELDERLCRVVECRFFAGYTEEETADALGVTARTVRRDWIKARGWLYDALAP